MNPSPLELEKYNFTRLHIEEAGVPKALKDARSDFVAMEHAQIRASVEIGEPRSKKENEPPHFAIGLRLFVEANKGESFPYRIELGLRGFFTVYASKGEDDARDLAAVNGTSMLYSIAREVVLAQTMRFEAGAVMLPSVHFLHLREAVAKPKPSSLESAPDSGADKSMRGASEASTARRPKRAKAS